jgi:Antibiotic biosynthesis monooxygenase
VVVWTVDTWRIKPGREEHFIDLCMGLDDRPLTVYRDLDKPSVFWSPAKWESLEALESWRGGQAYANALASLEGDIIDHETHVMEEVPGFTPRVPGRRG